MGEELETSELREQMEERINFDIAATMRRQVTDHLLSLITVELPTKLTLRSSHLTNVLQTVMAPNMAPNNA